jgi:hypothetical protein
MTNRYLFFRFDEKHIEDVLEFSRYRPVYICREQATNIHIHGIWNIGIHEGEDDKKLLDRYRTRLYRTLAERKNDGSKEAKMVEPNEEYNVIKYISKGKDKDTPPDVLYNGLFINYDIAHRDYWETNEQLESNKPKKSKRTIDQPTYINAVIEFMEKHKPGITEKGGFRKYKIHESKRIPVCKVYVLAWYVKVVKTRPNPTQLENMGATVYGQVLKKNFPDYNEDNEADICYKIAKRMLTDEEILGLGIEY